MKHEAENQNLGGVKARYHRTKHPNLQCMDKNEQSYCFSALAKGVNPENMDLVLPDESPEFDNNNIDDFHIYDPKKCFVYFKSKKIC